MRKRHLVVCLWDAKLVFEAVCVFYVSAGTYTHGARMEVRGQLLRAGSPSLWVPGAERRGVAYTVQCFNLLSHLTGPSYFLFN